MIVEVIERDSVFSIDLTAETMEDAAKLTRMGMNAKKEIRCVETYVASDGTFQSTMEIVKSKRANNNVPKRK